MQVAIIGVSIDENSSFRRGPAKAPPLIREAFRLESSNCFSENGTDLGDSLLLTDAGDVEFPPGVDPFDQTETRISELLSCGLKPLVLGGDHSITYPIVRSMARVYPSLTVVQFDSHPDTYDEFQGNRRSHACPFARIMENRLAIRLVQAGIRTATSHQRVQARRFGIETVEMKGWRGLLPELESPVYISFDLDCLDPAYAPGISHREPGGMSVRSAVQAIQGIRAEVIGADIMEFNPDLDVSNLTAMVCAKLLKELAAKMLEGHRPG
jgi:arginase